MFNNFLSFHSLVLLEHKRIRVDDVIIERSLKYLKCQKNDPQPDDGIETGGLCMTQGLCILSIPFAHSIGYS